MLSSSTAASVDEMGRWGRLSFRLLYFFVLGLPINNKLIEPMELSVRQKDEFLSRPFVNLGGEFPFPEDMLPKHSKAGSKFPLMTIVSSLNDVFRSGGDFTLLRRLWGYFLASLCGGRPEFYPTMEPFRHRGE